MKNVWKGSFFRFLQLIIIFLASNSLLTGQEQTRKGFAAEAGIGGGYTHIRSDIQLFEAYNLPGVNISGGIGFYIAGHSMITFGVESNIFVGEVGKFWQKWGDKMSGGGWEALGAIILAPAIYTIVPVFIGHSMTGMVKYSWFSSDKAPSIYLSGGVGPSIFLEKESSSILKSGLGLSGDADYEISNGLAIGADVLYTKAGSDHVHAIILLVGLRIYAY